MSSTNPYTEIHLVFGNDTTITNTDRDGILRAPTLVSFLRSLRVFLSILTSNGKIPTVNL